MPPTGQPKMSEGINIDLMEYLEMNQKPKREQTEEQKAQSIEALNQKPKRKQTEKQMAQSIEALKKAREAKVAKKRQQEVTKTQEVKAPTAQPDMVKDVKVEVKPEAKQTDNNSEILKGIYDLLKAQQQPKPEIKPPFVAPQEKKEVKPASQTVAPAPIVPAPKPIVQAPKVKCCFKRAPW